MKELDENDAVESAEPRLSVTAVKDVLEHLRNKKSTLEERLDLIEKNGGNEVSVVDPAARIIHQGGDGKSFNAESAKEIMDVEKIDVVADKGYYNADDIAKCEANNTTCYIPDVRRAGPNAPDENYNRENFRFDCENGCYICPDGNVLHFTKTTANKKGGIIKNYENKSACASCKNRSKCTKNKGGRKLQRSEKREILDIVDRRMKSDSAREIYRKRQQIIEHPFGMTKKIWGDNCFWEDFCDFEGNYSYICLSCRVIGSVFTQSGGDKKESEIALNHRNRIVAKLKTLDENPERFPIYQEEPWKSRGLRRINLLLHRRKITRLGEPFGSAGFSPNISSCFSKTDSREGFGRYFP
jgi:hypothetical protein